MLKAHYGIRYLGIKGGRYEPFYIRYVHPGRAAFLYRYLRYAGGDQEIIELSNLYTALHYLVSTRYEKQKSIFIV